jgi:hypothetical protein
MKRVMVIGVVIFLLAGGYLVAAEYYPCELPAFTARHAKQQVGHFMRNAGVNQKALDFISGLQTLGAGTEDFNRLRNDCQSCNLWQEDIGPFQNIWAASLLFPSKEGSTYVVIHIASCRAVLIERSLPPNF